MGGDGTILDAMETVVKGLRGGGASRERAQKVVGSAPSTPRKSKSAKQPRSCACGCGGKTKGGEFLPGHDSRHKVRLKKAAAEGNIKARAELQERGW